MNRFSVYDREEKTVLGLLKNLCSQMDNYKFVDANAEIFEARGGYELLGDRLDGLSLNNYYFKEGDNLSQVIKEHEVVILPSNGLIEVTERVDVVGKKLITIGKPCTIKAVGDMDTEVLYCGGSKFEVNNIILDCNDKGTDGVIIVSSERGLFKNVSIHNTVKSGIVIKAVDNWHWVENLQMNNVVLFDIGGHGFYLEVGEHTDNFINECSFKNIEIRGIGQHMNDSSFIYANCHGLHQGNKMSVMRWENCNFDANRGACNNNGFELAEHMAIFKHTENKNCLYEAWSFCGGGWESISGSPFQNGYTFFAEDGSVCKRFFIDGITTYNWTNGKVYNIASRTGASLNEDYHLDVLDGLKIRNISETVKTPTNNTFIQTKENTVISFTFQGSTVEPAVTTNIDVPFDMNLLSNKSMGDIFLILNLKMIYNGWRSFEGDNYRYKDYDIILHKRNWEDNKFKIVEKYTNEGGRTVLTLNTVTYDVGNKKFILNVTNWTPKADGGEQTIYCQMTIGSNIMQNPNFILEQY